MGYKRLIGGKKVITYRYWREMHKTIPVSKRLITTPLCVFSRFQLLSGICSRDGQQYFPSVNFYIRPQSPSVRDLSLFYFYYIPLTNRVRGPYCKLRTEFFPHRFIAQARSARAINRRGKRGSATYSTDRENEVSKIFIISLLFA